MLLKFRYLRQSKEQALKIFDTIRSIAEKHLTVLLGTMLDVC